MNLVKMEITEKGAGHTHKGKVVEAGDVIEVTPARSAWLLDIGVARPVRSPRKKSTASEPQEETPQEEPTEGAEETPELHSP